jgi:predicted NBD/HSP70 family sugar kinase
MFRPVMAVKEAQGPLDDRRRPSGRPPGGGVNSAWVRRVNAALVMRALRRNPGASQRELAGLTGLDKATVSAVVSQLVAGGFAARRQGGGPTRRLGRPAVALDIPRAAGTVFGVRLEPDAIAVVAGDLAGRIVDRQTGAGAADPARAVRALQAIMGELRRRLEPAPLRATGIGVPGLIGRGGDLLFGPNLGWRDVPLNALLHGRLGMPVVLDNDTNAAAIAEREFGCCRGVDDFVYVAGHSGIGGAVFVGGALYRGAGGVAGEFGHIKVVPGGRTCACGGEGCLEAYASVPGLLRSLAERGAPAAGLDDVARRAAAADALVLSLLAETGLLVGRVLSSLVSALNPSCIVIGGDLVAVAPWMLPALREELARSTLADVAAGLRIELSPLGSDAVLMGGVALALQKVDDELTETASAAAAEAFTNS